ncbi:hypothetical protein F4821DRAFT_118836 [Hypoxylon rubiginosum]|uniref:Uncharacterized protein n=1 Tax=Hypoxylon rubiginosum TaxID=110542 RepID=A0ACC0D2V0_9PEZI|nr:hypothetical protein F4821DRAFT_118836 [Hypoxylon rubiginosum]
MGIRRGEDQTLLSIFNNVPSPDPRPEPESSLNVRDGMQCLLESTIPGLETKLYPYQGRSAALMFQRSESSLCASWFNRTHHPWARLPLPPPSGQHDVGAQTAARPPVEPLSLILGTGTSDKPQAERERRNGVVRQHIARKIRRRRRELQEAQKSFMLPILPLRDPGPVYKFAMKLSNTPLTRYQTLANLAILPDDALLGLGSRPSHSTASSRCLKSSCLVLDLLLGSTPSGWYSSWPRKGAGLSSGAAAKSKSQASRCPKSTWTGRTRAPSWSGCVSTLATMSSKPYGVRRGLSSHARTSPGDWASAPVPATGQAHQSRRLGKRTSPGDWASAPVPVTGQAPSVPVPVTGQAPSVLVPATGQAPYILVSTTEQARKGKNADADNTTEPKRRRLSRNQTNTVEEAREDVEEREEAKRNRDREPYGSPRVRAEKRAALSDSLPYFRIHQGSLQTQNMVPMGRL